MDDISAQNIQDTQNIWDDPGKNNNTNDADEQPHQTLSGALEVMPIPTIVEKPKPIEVQPSLENIPKSIPQPQENTPVKEEKKEELKIDDVKKKEVEVVDKTARKMQLHTLETQDATTKYADKEEEEFIEDIVSTHESS